MSAAALILLAAAAFAADPGSGKSEISQDITVMGKASAPSLSVPPPAPSKPVVDEVLQSLALGRGAGPSGPETIMVSPETSRLEHPFPEAPFLALSPENIRALYDAWVFEVRGDDGEIAARSEGVGLLRESVDWDGAGPDGRLAISAGRRYRYRFTGRRGGREFAIESDPVLIQSFTHREYAGETRMEVAIDEIFSDEKSTFATGAERYLDRMADALRAGDVRADGAFHFELYARQPRSKLVAARIAALVKFLAAALKADPEKLKIAPMPVERGEALAAFVPPSKGARLRIE